MTNPWQILGSLRHRPGVTGPSRLRALGGTGTPPPTPLLATLATITATLLASAGLSAALPATASAYATIEGPPVYSSAPGLPDGRVYEQVSPADKNGNEAGAGTQINHALPAGRRYGVAAANGNSVLFEATGPIGETATGLIDLFVASKNDSASGWRTRSVTPAPQQTAVEIGGEVRYAPWYADPSADLSHALIVAGPNTTLAPVPIKDCGSQMYLTGPDPFVAATWLERPEIEAPIETCNAEGGDDGAPVGGTPDFSTVYFSYSGKLLPEDAARKGGWGFYDDSEGVLREAGVLPGGNLDPYGAVPAASGHGRALSGNQVADEGKRAFFVSPDPASCEQNGGQNNCAVDPPELYVREGGARTLLVSRDTLLPEAGGLPAPAPGGVLQMPNPTDNSSELGSDVGSYVFASPDGSQAFFQSEAQLTADAPTATADQATVTLSAEDDRIISGTFSLTVTVNGNTQTTTPIAYHENMPTEGLAESIQAALGALSNVGVGNVTVGGVSVSAGGVSATGSFAGGGLSFTATFGYGRQDATLTTASSTFSVENGNSFAHPVEEISLTASITNHQLPKMYDFDVDTGTLTYLPNVVGQVAATDADGSSLVFVRREVSPAQLDLWSAGTDGGMVTPITELPTVGNVAAGSVEPVRLSSDGSVVVFTTSASIAGFNNGGTHTGAKGAEPGSEQIYRYEVPANTLGCVSCPPHGVTPTGNAAMSQLRVNEEVWGPDQSYLGVDARGISADGSRVFFDTPDPLVPQDTNSGSASQPSETGVPEPQGDDVYEWENGVVYLISGGRSARNSFFLDNSANGNDVFFATTEGFVAGDTDGGYDVYDARVPQPGDNPPPAAVPCEGAVCQGPPDVPSPLTAPASATFSGLGDIAPEPAAAPPPARKATTKTVKCKKGLVKKKNKCVKKSKAKKSAKGRK